MDLKSAESVRWKLVVIGVQHSGDRHIYHTYTVIAIVIVRVVSSPYCSPCSSASLGGVWDFVFCDLLPHFQFFFARGLTGLRLI